MIRLDRLLTLYFFQPLKALFHNNGKQAIPILMYHSITSEKENGYPYFHINTSPKVFKEQMHFLKENDYIVISLEKAAQLLNSDLEMNEKYAVITFDDGYRDFLTEAYPVLDKYGFTATMFISTAHIGSELNKRPCLSWDEVRFLNQNNIEFGSHTVTHPKLYDMDFNAIEYELKESKNTIEQELSFEISSFSYPYAFPQQDKKFTQKYTDTLKHCNYTIGVTTKIGTVSKKDNPLMLKRIPVNTFDDLSFLQAKLDGAYNWLNKFQNIYKTAKNFNYGK